MHAGCTVASPSFTSANLPPAGHSAKDLTSESSPREHDMLPPLQCFSTLSVQRTNTLSVTVKVAGAKATAPAIPGASMRRVA